MQVSIADRICACMYVWFFLFFSYVKKKTSFQNVCVSMFDVCSPPREFLSPTRNQINYATAKTGRIDSKSHCRETNWWGTADPSITVPKKRFLPPLSRGYSVQRTGHWILLVGGCTAACHSGILPQFINSHGRLSRLKEIFVLLCVTYPKHALALHHGLIFFSLFFFARL